MQNVHFTPPEVARTLGVNVSTVKRWVDRGILPSTKTPGGHRRVSHKDFEAFIASREDSAQRSYVLKRLIKTDDTKHSAKVYYGALFAGEYERAWRVLFAEYLRGAKAFAIVANVIAPTLQMIGTEWIAGRLDIPDEHRMSFIIREHIFRLKGYLAPKRRSARAVVLACAPGENHELSLQLAQLLLHERGITAHVLGIHISAEHLIAGAESLSADTIIVVKVYAHDEPLGRYIRTVSTHCKKGDIALLYAGGGWSKREQAQFTRAYPNARFVQSYRDLQSV